jgi:N-acetylmuramoyl-L-alanine amidase
MVPGWACAASILRSVAVALSAVLAIAATVVPGRLHAATPAEQAANPSAPSRQTLDASRSPTRFVIGLERSVDANVFSLPSPNRVIVDLPDVKVQLPVIAGDQPVGLVKSFRGGLASAGKMRIVIEVTEPVVVESKKVEPTKDGRGHRLVIEIVPAEAGKAAAPKKPLSTTAMAHAGLTGVQPPLPKPAVRPEVLAARSFKPVVVLDPGHGGHDSGAVRNGAVEKEVVLLFGLVLRDKLNATGRYKVLMTRDSDKFVPLDDRRDFGENNKAALFIAIHADYAGAQARGATIYSLRENVANDLKRLAKGEVARNVLADSEIKALPTTDATDRSVVQGFLSDLAQTEVQVTKKRTSLFSSAVIANMGETTTMMNNPDRGAEFRVLMTAKVPAVLIELAYVSNKQDAAQLKSDEWRSKVASSIATAIDNYFSNQIARFPM